MALLAKLYSIFNRREQTQAILLVFLMLIGSIGDALGVGLILPFIALLSSPKIIEESSVARWLYDALGMTSYQQFIILACVALLIVYFFKNAYMVFLNYVQNRFVFNKQVAISRRLLETYLDSPYSFHLQRNSAELLRNITYGVPTVFNGVLLPLFQLMTEAMVVAAIGLILFISDPLSALIATVFLGVATFLFYFIVRRKAERLGKDQQYHYGQMIKWVNQAFGSIKETKVLGREPYFTGAYTEHSSSYAFASRFRNLLNQLPRYYIEAIAIGGILLIIITKIKQGQDLHSVLPVMALLAVAAVRVMPSLSRIVSLLTNVRFSKPALDLIYDDIMQLKKGDITGWQSSASTEASASVEKKDAQRTLFQFNREIKLNNVSFHYPGSREKVLNDVSLSIPKGSSVAFAGSSGAGKTTIIDIILGLLSPTKGYISVDDVNIQDNISFWQQKIGYIPQSIYLCDDTIRRNVALGIPDNLIDDEIVWQTIKQAQLDQFVSNLPEQLDTWVGEQGIRLSGGQRQRIGIARALYNDPEVLVMDEATSALDSDTEKEIVHAIERFSGEKTVIIIAHRVSTIEKCDVVYVLDNGTIAIK